MLTRRWQVVLGLIIASVIGMHLGYWCSRLYEITHGDHACFLIMGMLGIILGLIINPRRSYFTLTLATSINIGPALFIGAMLRHTPLFGLALVGTYYGILCFVLILRFAKTE
ncbi:MAG: hypothetical protein AAB920_02790 [Patescibacteria group bacterium]